MVNMRKSDADIRTRLEAARAALAETQAKLVSDMKALAELEQLPPVRARGTRDLTAAVRPLSLPEQVAQLLAHEPLDTAAVAERLGVPAGRVQTIIRKLIGDGAVHNVGTDVEPLWFHVIGDDGPSDELKATILRLMQAACRAFTHRELVVITGARENRISGILAKLKDDPKTKVVNLGTGARGRWFVLPSQLR